VGAAALSKQNLLPRDNSSDLRSLKYHVKETLSVLLGKYCQIYSFGTMVLSKHLS